MLSQHVNKHILISVVISDFALCGESDCALYYRKSVNCCPTSLYSQYSYSAALGRE